MRGDYRDHRRARSGPDVSTRVGLTRNVVLGRTLDPQVRQRVSGDTDPLMLSGPVITWSAKPDLHSVSACCVGLRARTIQEGMTMKVTPNILLSGRSAACSASSKATCWRWTATGDFPKPIKLGPNTTVGVWRTSGLPRCAGEGVMTSLSRSRGGAGRRGRLPGDRRTRGFHRRDDRGGFCAGRKTIGSPFCWLGRSSIERLVATTWSGLTDPVR